ncbi:hypothetical protein NC652_032894 [Populus alba x Populus x berolinensis]|nr:hypothetical protein NC652_032894 [Populus alba x Populus x berolinensis]
MLFLQIWYFMAIIVLTGHLEDPIIAVGSLSICHYSGNSRNHFAMIFTGSKEMRKAVANLACLLGVIMMILNFKEQLTLPLRSSHAGVAVGGGWQALVAYINLLCYYIVGLPLGLLLGYKIKLHVKVFFFYQLDQTSIDLNIAEIQNSIVIMHGLKFAHFR